MSNIRKTFGSVFVSGAVISVAMAPAAVLPAHRPDAAANQTIVAQPHGAGGPDGNGGGGGCARDRGWQGCGGFIPGQGGYGRGCIGNICGVWDGTRGWFVG